MNPKVVLAIVLALGFGGCLALIRQSGPARPRLSS